MKGRLLKVAGCLIILQRMFRSYAYIKYLFVGYICHAFFSFEYIKSSCKWVTGCCSLGENVQDLVQLSDLDTEAYLLWFYCNEWNLQIFCEEKVIVCEL